MKVNYDHHGHEHEFEPQLGLPEALPADERILWQGSPDWRVLARTAFHVRKLVVYFGVILALRVVFLLAEGGTSAEAVKAVVMLLPLALLAIGIAASLAWLASRTTVYTLTDRRVVMRIGIVLNLTFNLPLKRLATAGLHLHAGGTGDIPLALAGTDTIAYLHLWPHARPWRVAKPEPMLRAVPNAAEVSAQLADAWAAATGLAAISPVAAAAGKARSPSRAEGDDRAGDRGAAQPAHA
ncbi:MAG: phosphopantetheine adenylyltransferase [Methylibium sp. NZG]|nr:MAG: phosphopantetheine adenylyltransferase [Methylibium sp. NZG]